MKLTFTIFVLLLFSSLTSPQSKDAGFIANLGGGFNVSTGYFADNWEPGFNFFGSAGYIFHTNFGARVDVQYNSFPHGHIIYTTINGIKYNNGTVVSGGTCGTLSIKGDFLAGFFKKKSKIVVYGVLGAGLYTVSESKLVTAEGNTYSSGSDMVFGIGMGGGMGYKFSKNIAFFGEAQFNEVFEVFQPDPSYFSLKAGIMLTP